MLKIHQYGLIQTKSHYTNHTTGVIILEVGKLTKEIGMIIELTGIDGDKTFINTGCIIEFYRDNDETNIERHGGVDFLCKETPAQIQEMIMLDEFAKVALGGLCEWGEDIEDMTKGAY